MAKPRARQHDLFPALWGPHYWPVWHGATLFMSDAPDEDEQQELREFFAAFGKRLPCADCRQHSRDGLAKNPPPVYSRAAMVRWGIDVHNAVNRAKGKRVLSYEEAVAHLSSLFGCCLEVPGLECVQPASPGRGILALAFGALLGAAVFSHQ